MTWGGSHQTKESNMKLLVFQHIECERPGSLRHFLARDGVAWDVVELYRGRKIPD